MTAYLDRDWREVLASEEWAARMAAGPGDEPRRVSSMAEVINSDGVVVETIYPDAAAVDFDGTAVDTRRGSLSFIDNYPADETDSLHPLSGNRVRLWWLEWLPDSDGWVRVPVMTGTPEDPAATLSPALGWTVDLWDALAEAKRGGYGTQSVDVSYMTVTEALDALFDVVAPLTPRSIPESSVTLPSNYVLGVNDPDTDWQAIATLAGWIVWADQMGTITAGPEDDSDTPVADWQEGASCVVSKLTRTVTTSTVVNAVLARSSSADVVPPISAVVQDDDEGSATWVGRYGPFWEVVDSDAIADQAGADAVALATYNELRRPADSVAIEIPPRPDLTYLALGNLSATDLGFAGSYRVSGWKLTLPQAGTAPSAMTVTMAEAVA